MSRRLGLATAVGTGGGPVALAAVGQQRLHQPPTGAGMPTQDAECVPHLAHGQAGEFFLRRVACRTRKKWASRQRVTCRCQPCQLRPS